MVPHHQAQRQLHPVGHKTFELLSLQAHCCRHFTPYCYYLLLLLTTCLHSRYLLTFPFIYCLHLCLYCLHLCLHMFITTIYTCIHHTMRIQYIYIVLSISQVIHLSFLHTCLPQNYISILYFLVFYVIIFYFIHTIFHSYVLGSPFTCVIFFIHIFEHCWREPEIKEFHCQRLLLSNCYANDNKDLESCFCFVFCFFSEIILGEILVSL